MTSRDKQPHAAHNCDLSYESEASSVAQRPLQHTRRGKDDSNHKKQLQKGLGAAIQKVLFKKLSNMCQTCITTSQLVLI